MKEKWKRVWDDPVWSKVIASGIVAAGGFVLTSIAALFCEVLLYNAFMSILKFEIQLWIIIVIAVVILMTYQVYLRFIVKRDFAFLSFTSGKYQGRNWKWTWVKNAKSGRYLLGEIILMCPNCHIGVLKMLYTSYKCGNCGVNIPWNFMQTDSSAVKQQIMADTKRQFPAEIDYIG